MGTYLNPGNAGFKSARASRYVDKSGLIAVVNDTIGKKNKLTCVSRARRFGKTFAAQMLCAYYDRSCDSSFLFDDLKIAGDPSYREHLNKYNVICFDVTSFIGEKEGLRGVVPNIRKSIITELRKMYPEIEERESVAKALSEAVEISHTKFVAIIDEWDAVIRDSSADDTDFKIYLEFLRSLFKNIDVTDKVFAAAYMTGILPIMKDGSQSAISEFREYTMLDPGVFESYVGFKDDEVRILCDEADLSFEEMKRWYDGYSFNNYHSVYNPNSVIYALDNRKFRSYWSMSSSATALLDYINMDFDGLANAAADLLVGKRIAVDVEGFQNDTTSFANRDDVLTILIHYGYLSYDENSQTVRIPNEEIRIEFARNIKKVNNKETLKRVQDSIRLIEDTAAGNEAAVAEQIERIHRQEYTPLQYNKEQSLRGVIKLAYFAYRDYYMMFEEVPGGNGFADIIFIPHNKEAYPALVVELKWDDSVETAIQQIKERHYPDSLKDFTGDILLVGISYDKEDKEKKHHCRIEAITEE